MMNEPTHWIDRSDRFRLRIDGPDRLKFLHNLTTNEIKRLPERAGCEAFVTSPQGKILGFVQVHNLGNALLLRGDAAARETLMPHLTKYGMFDDISLVDLTDTTAEFHLFGDAPSPDETTAVPTRPEYSLTPMPDPASIPEHDEPILHMFHESPTGRPGVTFIVPREKAAIQRKQFEFQGFTNATVDRFDPLRIIAGTPVFGRDVTIDNLPQEVGRDARTISFVKGCYLGQETVARIDAIGHVNKILRGFQFSAPEGIAPGMALGKDGKAVGTITSTAVDPRNGRSVGLGYVRVQHADAGTTLDVLGEAPGTTALVTGLPIPEDG
jgi:folate-binding protein YgfZ